MRREITTVEIRNRKIRELRGGEGEPLLYLHSAGADNELWLPHLEGLAERRELHAPSHPGFLGSEGLDEIRDVEDLAGHYVDYLDAQEWESVDVVGLSFGGWIAAELAARFPARVRKLVLTDAVGIWIEEEPITDVFAIDVRFHPERMREVLFADPDSALAKMAFPDPDEEGKPVALPDEEMVKQYENQAAFAKVSWNPLMHDPRLEGILHHVTAPTLVLWGSEDRLVSPRYGERYAELIPNATLKVLPGCGHVAPMEKPELWLREIDRFLGG